MRFDQRVIAASWDEVSRRWVIVTGATTWSAAVFVLATGPLSEPLLPELPGLPSFTGPVFHSAQWDHTFDMRGKRVAVIGTGASAIQFVPRLQPQVAHLLLVQRTPPWVIPRRDRAIPAWRRSLYRAIPSVQRLQRDALYVAREAMILPFRHPRIARAVEWAARRHLDRQIADPVLRAKLTPQYTIGCKRILLSDDYYPALAKPNVEVSTARVTAVRAAGVETSDGRTHPLDAIILGTGFRVTDPPLARHIVGRTGVSLAESWRGSPTAYMGTTHVGFPNLFFLLGPNTGLGHSSVLLMVEAQIEHVLQVLTALRARNAESVEPTATAQARYVTWIDAQLSTTVWNRGGCRSWYVDSTGRNSALWPRRVGAFRRMVSRLKVADYHFTPSASNGTRVAME